MADDRFVLILARRKPEANEHARFLGLRPRQWMYGGQAAGRCQFRPFRVIALDGWQDNPRARACAADLHYAAAINPGSDLSAIT